jgi:uncharacterized protein (DUF1499 family)
MKWGLAAAGLVVVLALALGVYVRIAPTEPARWHAMPDGITNRDYDGGAMRVVGAGENGLERLHEIILATPRTKVLAGSPGEGMITYVSRSRLFGFPDYTTVRAVGPQIEIHGRLRFGKSDLGVNAARIDGWLQAFAQR